jgi:AcrR family transcriptional regulator
VKGEGKMDGMLESGVRERLIIAGINELSEHGVEDFSLRRTAQMAEVSCAAPYRHFKDKDDLLINITKYILSKWELLCREIASVFSGDLYRLCVEVSVATLRFFLANKSFCSILTLLKGTSECNFDFYLQSVIKEHCEKSSDKNPDEVFYSIRCAIYGAVMLSSMDPQFDSSYAVSHLREEVEGILRSV